MNIQLDTFLVSFKAKEALNQIYQEMVNAETKNENNDKKPEFFSTVFKWYWDKKCRLIAQNENEAFEPQVWFENIGDSFNRKIVVSQQDLIDDDSFLDQLPSDAELCILSIDESDKPELVEMLEVLTTPDDAVIWYWKEFILYNINYEKLEGYDDEFWTNYGATLKRWVENNIDNPHPFYQQLNVLQNTLNVRNINLEHYFADSLNTVHHGQSLNINHNYLPFVQFNYSNEGLKLNSGLSMDSFLDNPTGKTKEILDAELEELLNKNPKKQPETDKKPPIDIFKELIELVVGTLIIPPRRYVVRGNQRDSNDEKNASLTLDKFGNVDGNLELRADIDQTSVNTLVIQIDQAAVTLKLKDNKFEFNEGQDLPSFIEKISATLAKPNKLNVRFKVNQDINHYQFKLILDKANNQFILSFKKAASKTEDNIVDFASYKDTKTKWQYREVEMYALAASSSEVSKVQEVASTDYQELLLRKSLIINQKNRWMLTFEVSSNLDDYVGKHVQVVINNKKIDLGIVQPYGDKASVSLQISEDIDLALPSKILISGDV